MGTSIWLFAWDAVWFKFNLYSYCLGPQSKTGYENCNVSNATSYYFPFRIVHTPVFNNVKTPVLIWLINERKVWKKIHFTFFTVRWSNCFFGDDRKRENWFSDEGIIESKLFYYARIIVFVLKGSFRSIKCIFFL